jgi:ketosteroid isomerase-like protein
MKKITGLFVCAAFMFSCNNDPKTADTTKTETASSTAEMKDYELGDNKFVDIARKGLANLESGDIDAWMASFADNAVYRWNNLDSLSGKAAITDYWKKRRTDAIDSLTLTNHIWLAMKVNKAQDPGQLTGHYALGWNMVHIKYKTGKYMTQRIHTAFHFDANDKIDRVSQYLDRAPINAAMAK